MSEAAAGAEALLMRSPTDRDALKAIDEALTVLQADMARESAEFLARLNDLLVECKDAADGLRALSQAHGRSRYNLRHRRLDQEVETRGHGEGPGKSVASAWNRWLRLTHERDRLC